MAAFGWVGKKLGLPSSEEIPFLGGGLGGLLGAGLGFLIGGPMGAAALGTALGGATGAGLGLSIDQGTQQQAQAKKAMTMQQQQAEKLAMEQQQQYNKLNPKKPNIKVLQAQNLGTGLAETDLTGLMGLLGGGGLLGSNNTLGTSLGGSNILDLILAQNRKGGLGQ
jgi:hypothetical protein